MKLRIVAFGQRMPAWVVAGFDDYARRLPREFALELIELKPGPRARGKTPAQILAAEGERIAAATRGSMVIALDERGEAWSTSQLAARLRVWSTSGRPVAFVLAERPAVYLASKSARRQELLRQIGVEFESLLLREALGRRRDVVEAPRK